MGQQQNAQHYLAAGYGTFGYEPNVDYFFGVPRAIITGGAVMNIPILNITATDSPPDTAAEDKKNYILQIGILSSALEHAVPEQLFTTDPSNPADAISAVKALSKANAQGQRIYHITQANQGTALPNIHHDPDTMVEIQNALNVGKEVITHTDAASVPGWSGAGYIILDPVTGDGAYKIGGGQNGAWINEHSDALGLTALFGALISPFFSVALVPVVAGLALVLSLIVIQVKIAFLSQDLTGSCEGLLWLYGGISISLGLIGLKAPGPAAIVTSISSLFVEGGTGLGVAGCNILSP